MDEHKNQYLVFISHAGPDTWVAQQIEAHIREAGALTFLDEAHIAIGEDFEEEIRSAINQADELVVLLTPVALGRAYIWAEIGAAWGRGIPIVAVLQGVTPEELHRRAGIPVLLKRRDMIAINDLPRYFDQLQERARRYSADK